MTQKEAQKIRSAFNNGFEYPFGQGGFLEKCDMDEVERHAELLEMALEKQIPEKPVQIINPDGDDYLTCPRCRQEIGRCSIYAQYCPCCGQSLERAVRVQEERQIQENGGNET